MREPVIAFDPRMREDWDAKVSWMREVKADAATFDADGRLVAVTLAPDAPAPTGEPQHETPAAPAHTDEAQRRPSRATGRLVPRVVSST